MSSPIPPAVVPWGVCESTSPCESVFDAIPLPLSCCSFQGEVLTAFGEGCLLQVCYGEGDKIVKNKSVE